MSALASRVVLAGLLGVLALLGVPVALEAGRLPVPILRTHVRTPLIYPSLGEVGSRALRIGGALPLAQATGAQQPEALRADRLDDARDHGQASCARRLSGHTTRGGRMVAGITPVRDQRTAPSVMPEAALLGQLGACYRDHQRHHAEIDETGERMAMQRDRPGGYGPGDDDLPDDDELMADTEGNLAPPVGRRSLSLDIGLVVLAVAVLVIMVVIAATE